VRTLFKEALEKRYAALCAVIANARGQASRGGMIKTIFVGVILAVVLGMATSKIINNMPADNDVLGVISTAESMGPTIVTFIFLGLLVLAIVGLIRYFRAV